MKPLSKSTLSRILTVGVIIFLLTFFGPSLIHLGYRIITPPLVKKTNTERYHFLANAEVVDKSLSEVKKSKMRSERRKLFYWFHARGWDIDEDDEDSWQKPWKELMIYWNTP